MVELTQEEKAFPYVKYFNRELETIPNDKLAIAKGSAAPKNMALPIEEKNTFLAGTDKTLQTGFCVAENGTGFVANTTFMKDVTVDMMDWWFGWHCIGSDLRYKLWDHDDHYYARADKPEYILDSSVPLGQKTWGVNHSIKEDIGFGPEDITLCFKRPVDFGYDENLLGTEKCQSMVCAIGVGESPAFMTHKYYEVDDGLQFESRFWMGYGFVDNQLVKVLTDGVTIPEMGPRALFTHNIKEFTNLGVILPSLYEEEKDIWLYYV